MNANRAILASTFDRKTYLMGGHGTFTLRNNASETHMTFKVGRPDKVDPTDTKAPYFFRVLTGGDNTTSYTFLGTAWLRDGRFNYRRSNKSPIGLDAVSQKTISWYLEHIINSGANPPTLTVYHEGQCGACGRKLTVPESITRGIGPVCASRIAA